MSTAEQLLYGDGFWIGTLRFLLALGAFWFPGILWTRWLHRSEALPWTTYLVLGWVWSLAVFGLIAWPFLWFRLRFSDFLIALAIIWGVWTAVGLLLSVRQSAKATLKPNNTSSLEPPDPSELLSPQQPFVSPIKVALLYIFVAFILVWIPILIRKFEAVWHLGYWLALDVLTVAFVAALWSQIRSYRRSWQAWLRFDDSDHRPADRVVWVIVLGFIALQVVSAVVFDRPDWDDCYCLAAVLDFQRAERLNLEEPTHREGLPLNIICVLIAWELWQAVLSWASGLNAMVVAHALLPVILIPLAYAAYHGVLSAILPRRWVPLALLGVAAYHLWGISSHDTPANYLLTRIWQGKAVLMHIGLPVVVWRLHLLAAQPTQIRHWFSLLAAAVGGLAMSSSAIFLEVLLMPTLAACLWLTSTPRRSWLVVIAGILCSLPAVAMGLLLRGDAVSDPAIHVDHGPWTWWRGFKYLHHHTQFGSSEKIWFLMLPLLSVLLGDRRRQAYLVFFPVVALLTFANPFLADPVATYLTSYHTYFRVYWLVPVACGLGATLALLSRLLSKSLPETFPTWAVWQHPGVQALLPLAIALLGLLSTLLTPGLYVWSRENLHLMIPDASPHRLAENPAKMPTDLIVIADRLLSDEGISQTNILATEEVVSYLTPLSRDFRFVHTRIIYTLQLFDRAGRREEGQKRYLLSLLFEGKLPQKENSPPRQFVNEFYPLPKFPNPPVTLDKRLLAEWLDELRVRYAVTPHFAEPKAKDGLQAVGFREVWRGRQFTFWVRELGPQALHRDSVGSEGRLK